MSEDDFLWAKNVSDEYRRIRKYMSEDFYNHGSDDFDDTSWVIWQYNDAKTESGIVMAFRRSNSPFDSVIVELKGLDKEKNYAFVNLDDNSLFISGNNLKIDLPHKRSCVIFEYKPEKILEDTK